VLNAVKPRTNELQEARALVEKMGIPLAGVHISDLVAYSRAITAAQGATEFEPGGKASQEIQALFKWISLLLDLAIPMDVDKSASLAAS
jgi:chromosome partitioning protein